MINNMYLYYVVSIYFQPPKIQINKLIELKYSKVWRVVLFYNLLPIIKTHSNILFRKLAEYQMDITCNVSHVNIIILFNTREL